MHDARPHLVHLFTSFDFHDAAIRTARIISGLTWPCRHTIIALDRRMRARDLIPAEVDAGVIGGPAATSLPGLRALRLRRLLVLLQPDLLATYGASLRLGVVANAARPATPHLHHDEDPDERHRAFGCALERRWRARADALVTPCGPCARRLRAGTRRSRPLIAHLPNGVERPDSRPRRVIPGLHRRPGDVVVGIASTFEGDAHLEPLIRAFGEAGHENAQVAVLGDGPERAAVAALVERAGLGERVLLTGDLGEPAAFLEQIDLLAVGDAEAGTPLIALEAMARGLPLVGLGRAALRDLVSPANRDFILPPANAYALVARLDALLQSGQLRHQLGRANRLRASDFGLQTMVDAYGALYLHLLDPDARREDVAFVEPGGRHRQDA